ncbi:sugar phosphate nucleotidyltransferase [Ectobacillus panaciterrae]|uniref:sugar phosphate nucleotidyltransferase n=1 Tax=Ectobacillus panaciterrae TaxID=363872 RepID=UPI0004271324|nr:sugar phosphate nucleotidyltransferase [Ectobacillus panaciterrae]
MKLILLSGGSGKRLWPLSNKSRPKQFLKILRNKKNNQLESMVQRVWNQLRSVNLENSTYVAIGKAQIGILQNQLGSDIPIIIEPEMRDTFPAVALAASFLYSKVNIPLDEIVCVLPTDSYVDEQFYMKIKDLENVLIDSGADLALVGTKPAFPSEKYGYIIPEQRQESLELPYVTVKGFKEKPSKNQAEKLIQDKAFWNCGVFAFKLSYVISILHKNGWPIKYEELIEQYGQLPKVSFDYEVLEKSNNIVMVEYEGIWKDLGTWNTLAEEIDECLLGEGMIHHSANTNVINELNTPVVVLGLSNIIVVRSPDGILISDKSKSTELKGLIKYADERPMYEERHWGWYRVLDYSKIEPGREALTKKIAIQSGKNISYQSHNKRREVWTIISGEGAFVLDDKLFHVKPDDVLEIPIGAKHSIKAITDLELIEVQIGSELIEEDISVICVSWEEIEEYLSFVGERTPSSRNEKGAAQ